MIFGSQNDFKLFVNINRELLSDVIEQEVLYYKMSLEQTQTNLYGEAQEKVYWEAVKFNCLIDRGDQQTTVDDFGPDASRAVSFKFLRQDLKDANTVPQVGDIIQWEEDFYEVDNTTENQLFLGKDENYALTNYGPDFGGTLSITCICHLTRADKVGIVSRYEATVIDQASITAASLTKEGGLNTSTATTTGTTAGNSTTTPAPGYNIGGKQYTPVKVSTLSWEPHRRIPQYMKNQNPRIIKFYWEDLYWKFMNLTFYREASATYLPDTLYNIVEINGVPTLNPYGPPPDGNYIINYDDFSLAPNRSLGTSTVDNPAIMVLVNSVPTAINLFDNGSGTMTSGDPIITTPTSGGTTNGGLFTKTFLATSVYYNSNSSLPSYNFNSLLPISNQSFKAQILSTLTVPNANNQFANWQAFNLYVDGPIQVGTKVRNDEYGITTFNLGGNVNNCIYLTITEDSNEPQRTLYLDKLESTGYGSTYWNPFYNPKFELVRVISGSITEVTPFSSIT